MCIAREAYEKGARPWYVALDNPLAPHMNQL